MKKTELIKPAWLLIKMSTQKRALINKKNQCTEKVLKHISQKRNAQSIYEKKCTQKFRWKKCTGKMLKTKYSEKTNTRAANTGQPLAAYFALVLHCM